MADAVEQRYKVEYRSAVPVLNQILRSRKGGQRPLIVRHRRQFLNLTRLGLRKAAAPSGSAIWSVCRREPVRQQQHQPERVR